MYSASDYRSMARRALKNYWWLAVGVTLLASILGGTSSGFTPSFNITINGDDLTQSDTVLSRDPAPRAARISPRFRDHLAGAVRHRRQRLHRPQPLLPEAR